MHDSLGLPVSRYSKQCKNNACLLRYSWMLRIQRDLHEVDASDPTCIRYSWMLRIQHDLHEVDTSDPTCTPCCCWVDTSDPTLGGYFGSNLHCIRGFFGSTVTFTIKLMHFCCSEHEVFYILVHQRSLGPVFWGPVFRDLRVLRSRILGARFFGT